MNEEAVRRCIQPLEERYGNLSKIPLHPIVYVYMKAIFLYLIFDEMDDFEELFGNPDVCDFLKFLNFGKTAEMNCKEG